MRPLQMLPKTFLSLLLAALLTATSAWATDHPAKKAEKTAILLVTFGTSVKSAQTAFDHIDRRVRTAFPATEIRWAYTSKIIRDKLAREEGKSLDSPGMALARLMDDGYTKVAVQSLHMIPGEEFYALKDNARLFAWMEGGISRIVVGSPLLSDDEAMDKTLQAVLDKEVPRDRKKDEAVVLMGHGTSHYANAVYGNLMYRAQRLDPHIYVATVEGSPSFDDIMAMLLQKKIKKAYLIPFMTVAGDHATNDMAGSEPDSWKNLLKKEGIEAKPVLKGLAELDPVVDIWIAHLKTALAHL